MKLVSTKLNLELANLVRKRIGADLFYIAGRSGFLRAVGVGSLGLGVGAAVGLFFCGYSFVTRNTTNSDLLSTALAKALADVQLRSTADGVVQLEPSEIRLAKDQTISIDGNSRLRLDPSA